MISWTSIIFLTASGFSLLHDILSSLVQPGVGEHLRVFVVAEDDVPLHRSRVVQSGDSVAEQE
jgi:hypothetical protein